MSLASGVGIISGINVEDIISKLTAVSRRPINNLMSRQIQMRQKITAYESINRKLLALNDAMANLKDASDFQNARASSSDADILRATGSSAATEGSYSVKVTQLAQAERRAAQGVAAMDTVIASGGGGTFSFKVGNGETKTITVGAGMTLQQLRGAINQANAGVTANIVNDGSSANPYRLVLSVSQTGADNALTILTNNTILNFDKTVGTAQANGGNAFNGAAASSGTYTGTGTKQYQVQITTGGAVGAAKFKVSTDGGVTWSADDAYTTSATPVALGQGVEIAFTAGTMDFAVGDAFTIEAFDPFLQQAQNAKMEVDGIAVERATNTFEDVIEGVTLTAVSTDADAVKVDVAIDKTNALSPIQQFVNAYNDLIDEIGKQASYDSKTQVAKPLFGDFAITSIRSQLVSIITNTVPGIASDKLNSLAQAGVSLQSNGKLKVDVTKLNDALSSDYDEVMALFATTGSVNNDKLRFVSASNSSLPGGAYSVNVLAPAERAQIAGANVIDPSGLAADETLTFTVGDVNITANLAAGDTLEDIITKINAEMTGEETGIVAYDEGGKLGLHAEAYGSAAQIKVRSSVEGAGTTGIGTTQQTDTGVDVAGTINGVAATGTGRMLTGSTGSTIAGLQLEVLATEAGNAGSIDVSFGVGELMARALEGITDNQNGLIKIRTDGLNSSITALDERINKLNERISSEADRLRAQFRSMESQLAALQSQSSFISSTLAGITAMITSS